MEYVPPGWVEPPPSDPIAAEAELRRALYESRARDVKEAEAMENHPAEHPDEVATTPNVTNGVQGEAGASPTPAQGVKNDQPPSKRYDPVAMARATTAIMLANRDPSNWAQGVKNGAKPPVARTQPSSAVASPSQAQGVKDGGKPPVAQTQPSSAAAVPTQAQGVKDGAKPPVAQTQPSRVADGPSQAQGVKDGARH
jgi:hypothetical protein